MIEAKMTIGYTKIPGDLLDNTFDGIYFVDRDLRITYWNPSAERITGYLREAILGQECHDTLLNYVTSSGAALCEDRCALAKTMKDGTVFEAEVFLQHAGGHRVPVLIRIVPLRDERNLIIGAAEIISNNPTLLVDRLRSRRADEAVRLDPLTGIGNHDHVQSKLKSAISEIEQQPSRFGVLFIDIDNFLKINDHFGSETGDKVLKMVATTLRNSLRASDTCGRWDGEEFVVIAYDVDGNGLKIVAEKLRVLVEKAALPLDKGGSLHATITIGATLVRPGDTEETLIKRTESLVQMGKQNGGNRVTIN
jgi:diguanylate cyclase (GGDEF)-like protein/PAS domain S-box-containing protein